MCTAGDGILMDLFESHGKFYILDKNDMENEVYRIDHPATETDIIEAMKWGMDGD